MKLSELHTGERGIIRQLNCDRAFCKRLMEMGFIEGEEILVVKNAPLKDPVEYRILNYDVTLRRSEASLIEVEPIAVGADASRASSAYSGSEYQIAAREGNVAESKRIRVAFVGNPNCGKTSLFNAASGANEHVGNYSGVTVEAKTAIYKQAGYTFELIDLPGAYSLSSYSPEERFIMQHLLGELQPDVILNVVDATNLERNMYLTTQLMEMSLPMVVALNMWDELEASNSTLDVEQLTKLVGIPMAPTVGRTGKGLKQLFGHIIMLYQRRSHVRRVIDVQYRTELEEAISYVSEAVTSEAQHLPAILQSLRPRYIALKLLEEDEVMRELLKGSKRADFLESRARYAREMYQKSSNHEVQTDVTNGRYGFVRGALQQTYQSDYVSIHERNQKIDHILTHKIWGFPIFLFIMYLTFQITFTLGAYPMEWIEMGVAWLGERVGALMSDGPLKDLLVDGVIAGVGGVLVFLPNIVILYLCLSIIEDTGYMARAAFIMDRIMHLIGLHGKSFIPMIMGFGCNVPAIMATRTIENRNNRLVTMLVIPFMSCSAKLPVYLLLAGAFFPKSAGTVLFALYLIGVLIAVLSALLFKHFVFTAKDVPFVMELPPYRVPTAISVLLHMWQRAKQYLQKMGSVILVASIIIWALGYFPRLDSLTEEQKAEVMMAYQCEDLSQPKEPHAELLEEGIAPLSEGADTVADTVPATEEDEELREAMIQQEYSYIGRLGHTIEPIFRPLGYDWRMSVALLTGVAAKEVVVSTMGVLYTGDGENEVGLTEKIQSATDSRGRPIFDPVVAFSFMVFVLIYVPCISTVVAIGRESGSWKWALFSAVYTIALAWVVGLLITQVGHWLL